MSRVHSSQMGTGHRDKLTLTKQGKRTALREVLLTVPTLREWGSIPPEESLREVGHVPRSHSWWGSSTT